MAAAQQCVTPLALGARLDAALADMGAQHLPAAWASALQKKFDTLVMCNFKPRHPSELQTSRWVSLKALFRLFQPHAPMDVWLKGPGNLKQLITAWYQSHPAFAGLAVDQWCKRLTINDQQDGPGCHVFKFCFEYSGNGTAAI